MSPSNSRFLAFLALATSLAFVGVSASPHKKLANASPPTGYKQLGPAPSDETIAFRIALPQRDFAGLDQALLAVSTPGNSKYGQHLSKAEVNAFVAPSQEHLDSVQKWLESHGLSSSAASPGGDWITVNATVEQANELLGAEFMSFSQPGSDENTVIRTLKYTIPDAVKDSIIVIHPLVTFPAIRPQDSQSQGLSNLTASTAPTSARRATSAIQSRANDSTLPESCISVPDDDSGTNWEKPFSAACRFDAYGIPRTFVNQSENTLWISGMDNEFLNKQLLKETLGFDRPEVADMIDFDFITIDGGLNNQLPAGASIYPTYAARVIGATSPGVRLTFMSVGTDTSGDPLVWYLDQANYLLQLEDDKLPKVLLGNGYPVMESMIDRGMATQICNAYAQLAARGVSIIVAGDTGGVEGGVVPSDTCARFDLSFPSSCPYVTSVGATTLESGGELGLPRMTSNNGGFSDFFARPSWQDDAVLPYLDQLGGKYEGMFNASGRALPDLSATEYLVISPGKGGAFGSPIWSSALVAGMVALINDELITAGKPTLGFLNPWLYANKGEFYDITTGNNPGCKTDGFNATAGWDPVIGIGAPRFAKLRAAAGL